jgi:hypothetical protein
MIFAAKFDNYCTLNSITFAVYIKTNRPSEQKPAIIIGYCFLLKYNWIFELLAKK